MTGLDLESFLLLLRADLTTWAVVAMIGLVLASLVRLSWGSRRALRKCLVASLIAHVGLAYSARSVPAISQALGAGRAEDPSRVHIRKIQVLPVAEEGAGETGIADRSETTKGGGSGRRPLDRTIEPLVLSESKVDIKNVRPRRDLQETPERSAIPELAAPQPVPLAMAVPPLRDDRKPPSFPIQKKDETASGGDDGPSATLEAAPPAPSEADRAEIPPAVPLDAPGPPGRPDAEKGTIGESLASVPDRSLRGGARLRPDPGPTSDAAMPDLPIRGTKPPIPLARATPAPSGMPGPGRAGAAGNGEAGLADLIGAIGNRPLQDVPPVYRPRLDPNRSVAAKRAGASEASEQAVERALDWLARHQDDDGRWDGGTARDVQGDAVDDDDDFTVHCPPGQACFGECIYWEADTAVTGLALLTFLGSGYTQKEGRHSASVEKGLQFLIRTQKPDGDLRGKSRAVGMYCHAMASLALCEAYALTGDGRLREPVTRAVAFAIAARAKDRQAWRYSPGEPVGDTSILGWVVMLLKSARESEIAIPESEDIQLGILKWLERVAAGERKGLARYQLTEPVTPTMTAEAWVCRQFLGGGGPGPASEEAAQYLIRNPTDRGKTNLYYWYYATLAMYQHGGEHWARWNALTRDRIVGLQRTSGHQSGSWDPDESIYGVNGGRIYCTAMAALTLEVYYRYLRLYDRPNLPAEPTETSPPSPGISTPRLRPPL